jgi:hypothetical protein
VFQRGTLEQFHHQKGHAVFFADVVNRADVGVIQGGGGLCLAAEAFESNRIAGNAFGQKFQRDVAAKADVFGLINDAHAAAAELFQDAVVRDCLANHQSTCAAVS